MKHDILDKVVFRSTWERLHSYSLCLLPSTASSISQEVISNNMISEGQKEQVGGGEVTAETLQPIPLL